MRLFRVGVIGCGQIGSIYVDVLRELGHDVVAVVDVDTARAQGIAGDAAVFASLDDMFAAGVVPEALGISTPPAFHVDSVLDCAARGIAMLCEKPLAPDVAGAEAAIRACELTDTPLAIGFKMRFEPLFRRVAEVLAADEIGPLRHLHIAHYQPPRPGAWSADVGVIAETLSHAIDLSRWLLGGDPIEVAGRSIANPVSGADEVSRIHLFFDGGRDALIAGGWMPGFPEVGGTHDHFLLAVGERGYVMALRPDTLIIQTAPGRRTEQTPVGYAEPFREEWRAFLSMLDGEPDEHLAREADALAVQRVLAEIAGRR